MTEGSIKKFLLALTFPEGRFSVFLVRNYRKSTQEWPNFLTVSSDFNDFSVEKMLKNKQDRKVSQDKKVYTTATHTQRWKRRIKPIKQRYELDRLVTVSV